MAGESNNEEEEELRESSSSSEEEEEEEKLVEEVETMAERITEYRTTIPDQMASTLSSLLAAQRPVTTPEVSEDMPLLATDVPEEAEKIQLLKQKIVSNASTLPSVLNRLKECVARIDKLQSSNSNGNIHPAFKRKRIT